MTADGVVRVTDTEGNVLMEQPLKKRHFRMLSIKDAPIQDWVKLQTGRVLQTYLLYF
jgi:isocitrate dehydrogenase